MSNRKTFPKSVLFRRTIQLFCVLQQHLVVSYLKHDNLAVVSLQVEGPGGGDEALGRADDVVAPTGHGFHH